MVLFQNKKSEERLEEIKTQEEEDLIKILANKYKLPYVDLSLISIDIDALKLIPEEKARVANIAAFQTTGKKLSIAVLSPNMQITKNIISELEEKEYKINLFMTTSTGLKRAWKRYAEVPEYIEITKGVIEVSSDKIEEYTSKVKTFDDLKAIFESFTAEKKKRKVSEVVEVVMAGAIKSDASDIHLEPKDGSVGFRLRIDGVLHEIFDFSYDVYQLLLSRIKLVSGLKLNIKNKAQDGRFSIHIKDLEIEIRVSLIPGGYGESIVMRILNPKAISVTFESLGIEPHLYEILSKEIEKPNGMLLTTGPTGSGKTTTLYAILKKINSPDIKIITLEDPIEYHLTGITQTQTNEKQGYTFANGLRAILRQDPDIILVGEIRDLETAKIAINSALTGHLVLSTLHTNNAAGTIPRLIDLGVNPNIIAPALNISLAQRLVRKLCQKCKKQTKPKDKELEIIKKIFDSFPKNIPVPDIKNINIWNQTGCTECNNIGYKGRIGIYEAILLDENIEKIILDRPNETAIQKSAESQGILTMVQDGILKVINGVTSLEELKRVIELET